MRYPVFDVKEDGAIKRVSINPAAVSHLVPNPEGGTYIYLQASFHNFFVVTEELSGVVDRLELASAGPAQPAR